MLTQLLRFTLVSSLLLWLRPRWKGLLALAVAVVMVHVFHGEYLEYVQLSGNDAHLVSSYVIKWLLLFAVAGGYLGFLFLGARPGAAARSKGKSAGKNKDKRSSLDAANISAAPVDDGFDFLRDKGRLQSKADKVIESGGGRR